ncbi:hypothetical protein DMA15_02980 [Streptomyces sp. WAC 01529]|uniref:DUF6271 family protein n=1 Tax=Streptomyces sp. WAC 01529 TaxID=2203205 RepID=UPI000F709513|nr:DUF6271 family protein [Streptomyces sp. WAC 01529]AZM51672.1 hypothetical protein DMA15_02980 [Streptomyces sp. WAC 01529]
MRRICLTLPTNRACPETIAAIGGEAAYAAAHFDVEVRLLILDSSDPDTFTAHAGAVRALGEIPGVITHHLDEARQRDFLRRVIARAEVAKPELVLELMLPAKLSYGACTNRAFLIAAALGCESVHRRDSDSRYQLADGQPVFPVHHELTSLGKRAADAAHGPVETALDQRHADKRVAMVAGSFVGELSVDIGEIRDLDPEAYYDVVSLWAPGHWSDAQKRELVDDSFRGAGTEPFTGDHATLTLVDPMRVDMCNISFHGVHERVPLPPATDTIGSDYFLIHLVHDAALPGVLHNRHIVNFYTPERRTDAGFTAYQTRFVKFFLSMLYFNEVYDRMAEAGDALLDESGQVRGSVISALARRSATLDRTENVRRLDRVDAAYRGLGGRYARFADFLATRRERLLDEARRDIEDFALLTEAWEPLVRAGKESGPHLPAAAEAGRPT